MQCPNCPDTALQMTDRQGIEIDYCPQCRGVWLDRGELDKLIERAAMHAAPAPAPAPRAQQAPYPQQQPYPQQRHEDYRHHGKRKSSWLSELFD